MSVETGEDTREYIVLINDEGQYSIWLMSKEIPRGWRAVDKKGSKSQCVDYIDEVWTDMRPISLRTKMQGSQSDV